MANFSGNIQVHPVQELEQNYPGVEFIDEVVWANLYLQTQGKFQFRVKIWGWQFVEHGKLNKKTVKKAVAEKGFETLKRLCY